MNRTSTRVTQGDGARKHAAKWLFVSDAPPYPGAAGCHFVARNICAGLDPNNALLLTRRFSRRFSHEKIVGSAGIKTLFWTDSSLFRFRQLSPLVRGKLDFFLFRLQLPGLLKKINRFEPDRILALSGADPFFLLVVRCLGRSLNLRPDLYLVDDFEESARAQNNLRTMHWIQGNEAALLEEPMRLWTISPGYADHLNRKHRLSARFLPLPMPVSTSTFQPFRQQVSRTLTFIGSVNYLYQDVLASLYKVLSEKNRIDPVPWRLVIYTLANPERLIAQLEHTKYLDIYLGRADQECAAGLRSAYAVVLPYTFDQQFRTMVATSFSCKTFEALSAGRPILVVGPPYASVPRYFLEHSLPIVVTNLTDLGKALDSIAQYDCAETISRYAEVARSNHDPACFMKRLEGR